MTERQQADFASAFFVGMLTVPINGGEYVLLVGAYKGAQTPQDAAVQHLTRETKGFEFKELGAGSHFVPMEHPEWGLKEIRNFID